MKPTLAPWQFLSFYKSLLQWKTSQCKFLNFLKAANTSWNFKVKNYILLNLYKCVWMWNFFNPLIEKRPGQKFQAFYNWIIHPVKGKKDELFSKISLKFEKMNQDQFIFSFDFMHACVLSCFSHIQLFVILWTVACQGPLSMGFSRQEYWSGLPSPPPGDLPNPGIEPRPPVTLALQADFLLLSHKGSPRS